MVLPQVGWVTFDKTVNVVGTTQAELHALIVFAAPETHVKLPSVCLDEESPAPEAIPIYSAWVIGILAGPDKEETTGHPPVPDGIRVGFVLISLSVPHLLASPALIVQ